MSILVFNERATPTTPAAGKTNVWSSNEATPLPKHIDDAGMVTLLSPMVITSTSSDFTGTNVNTAQPVFNTTEDTITVPGSTAFMFEGQYHIHTTGTTSHQLGLLFGGTATYTSIGYQASVTNAATEVTGAPSTIWISVATVTNVSPATATATHHSCLLKGIMRINAGGTVIPQYQWSAAPGVAGVVLANSYFAMWPIGANTMTNVGPWS